MAETTVKLSGDASAGLLALIETVMPPGALVTPHAHSHEDEVVYVLEGEIGVRIGGTIEQVAAGTSLFKRRNVPHAHWNAGDGPARILEIYSPAGLEELVAADDAFFDQAVISGRTPEVGDEAARLGLSARWFDWLPQLKARYPTLQLPLSPVTDQMAT